MTRFQLASGRRPARGPIMAREVRSGLSRAPRSIPPKYFYDAAGSRLFDTICELPEYYLTRAELALLLAHADAIVEEARPVSLIEIGSGMARKTGPLVRAMCERVSSPTYVPFDIEPEAIRRSAGALLADHPSLRVHGIVGDFAHDCARLADASPSSDGPRLFAFLGSTIGNLDEKAAPSLLRSVAELMTEQDRFLLGMDLVKDPAVLYAAYNDSQGVTAAFNKNILRVLARELDGDVDEHAFEHLALYEVERQRIEMHLVSLRPQTLRFRAANLSVELARGERVLTEISRKFSRATAERTLAQGGMELVSWLSGAEPSFALCIARAARPGRRNSDTGNGAHP